MQGVLSGFSTKLFYFVQTKTLHKHGCIYFLVDLVLVYVYLMVISST